MKVKYRIVVSHKKFSSLGFSTFDFSSYKDLYESCNELFKNKFVIKFYFEEKDLKYSNLLSILNLKKEFKESFDSKKINKKTSSELYNYYREHYVS